MLEWIIRGLRRGRVTTRYPAHDEEPFLGFRGRVEVLQPEGADASLESVWACPTGAITVDRDGRVGLDRGRCILCGECVGLDPERFGFRSTYETAARRRGALAATAKPEPGGVRAALGDRAAALRRSIHVRHVDAGSDGSEEWEIQALTNPYYDVQRLGIFFTSSPRHADVLLVTGPVTTRMREPLLAAYHAMPEPRRVAALGDCALGCNLLGADDELVGRVDTLLPVDLRIPGCPPTPETIATALLALVDRHREHDGA